MTINEQAVTAAAKAVFELEFECEPQPKHEVLLGAFRKVAEAALTAAAPHMGGDSQDLLERIDGVLQENITFRSEIDKLKAQLAEAKAEKERLASQNVSFQSYQAIDSKHIKHLTAKLDHACKDNDNLRAQLTERTAERDDLAEQLTLRQPSAVELDMQLIMARNNELLAENESLRAEIAAKDEALEPFAKIDDR